MRARPTPRIVAAMAAVVLVATLGVTRAPAAPPAPPSSAGLAAGSRPWIYARLGEADRLLREGRPRAAARAFRDVFTYTAGTDWGTLAELGLAWSVATSGDVELGRALAEDAHAAGGPGAETTRTVLALLSARAGDGPAALALLDRAPPPKDPRRATVVALARAYALFWSGDHASAAAAFDAVASLPSADGLVDDARYGAAWSRFQAGDRDRAIADLDDLVRTAPPGFVFRSVPQRLVELDARAMLTDGTRRYRRGERLAPDAQLARLLDGDGLSRARSALRLLDPARFGEPLAVHPATATLAAAASDPVAAPLADRSRAPAKRDPADAAASNDDTARHDLVRVLLGLVLLVVLAALGWSLTRRRADSVAIEARHRFRSR